MTDDRLIFTVARGSARYREMALGLGRSLRLLGGPTRTAILTDIDADWDRYYDVVLRATGERSYLDKLRGLEVPQADRVISIDCDSLVFRPLEPIFDDCEGIGFAVQGDSQSTGSWYGADVAEVCRRVGVSSIPRFNSGLLYYERGPDGQRVIESARAIERDYATSSFELFRGKPADEVCISLAMAQTECGKIVPDEKDFMSTGVGLIGPLRMDVRFGKCEYLCRRSRVRFIRPYVFHASRYSNFLIYWRQLARLERLWTSRSI